MKISTALLSATLLAGSWTMAFAADTASAELKGPDGKSHGSATLTETPAGVLIKAELTGLPAGALGFHIHAAGNCEPPFKAAGGHFNPTDAKHGFMSPEGPHAGDMPNIHVPESGDLTVEVLNTYVTLKEGEKNSLLGGDGTSLMVHAGHDDHASDPAGDAGDRIACGVIK